MTVEIEAENNTFEGLPSEGQADTEQVIVDTEQTIFVHNELSSDEKTAQSIAKKHGVEFIKLSETELTPHIVRLLPQWLVTQYNVIAIIFKF